MYYFSAGSADTLYKDVMSTILKKGQVTHPRGFTCLELSPCVTELWNPQANIITNPIRKINKGFAAAELLWMLSGRNDVEFVNFYNSNMAKFSDNGITFFGAYGPKIMEQLPYLEKVLKGDEWTRQGVLNIWRECPPETKDVPCTVMMQFIRRPVDILNLYVTMRSQDIWLGFPYDIHNFSSILLIMSSILGLTPGRLIINQGSMHAYKENFVDMEKAIVNTEIDFEITPKSTCGSVEALVVWGPIITEANEIFMVGDLPKYTPDYLNEKVKDPLLQQKLTWMFEFAQRKRTK